MFPWKQTFSISITKVVLLEYILKNTHTDTHTHADPYMYNTHTCTYSHIPAVYSAIGTSHMFVLPLLCSCYPVSVSDKWHCGYAMGKGVMRVFKCVWRGFR